MTILKKVFINNWQIKLLALASAIIFWFYVASSYAKIGNFPGTIPIEFRNMPSNLVAISDNDQVTVKLVAEGLVWQRLSSNSLKAYVDLAGLSTGTYELEVKVDVVVTGVQVVEKNPNKILVRLEQKISKEVPVVAKIEGQAGEGLVYETPEILPNKVEVTGPKSYLDNIFEATAVATLSGETETKTINAALAAFDSEGDKINQITFSPSEVKLIIPLVKIEDVKSVGVLPKLEGTVLAGWNISKIDTSPSTVNITGKSTALRNINYLETMPINVNDLSESKTFSSNINLPAGIALINPTTIKVTVQLSQITLSKEIIATLRYQNLASNLQVSNLDPNTVKVVLTGSQESLQAADTSNVILNLNFAGKNSGTFNLDISKNDFQLPKDTSIINIFPTTLSATVLNK